MPIELNPDPKLNLKQTPKGKETMSTLTSGQRGAQTRAKNEHTRFFDERDNFMLRGIMEYVYPSLNFNSERAKPHAWLRDWIVIIHNQGRYFQRKHFHKEYPTQQISQNIRSQKLIMDFMSYVGQTTRTNGSGETVALKSKISWKQYRKGCATFLVKCVYSYMQKHECELLETIKRVLNWANDLQFITLSTKGYDWWFEKVKPEFLSLTEISVIENYLTTNNHTYTTLVQLFKSSFPEDKAQYFHDITALYELLVSDGKMDEKKEIDCLHYLVMNMMKKNGDSTQEHVTEEPILNNSVDTTEEPSLNDSFDTTEEVDNSENLSVCSFDDIPPASPPPEGGGDFDLEIAPLEEERSDAEFDYFFADLESSHHTQTARDETEIESLQLDVSDYYQNIFEEEQPMHQPVVDTTDYGETTDGLLDMLDDLFCQQEDIDNNKRPREEDYYYHEYEPASKQIK